MRELFFLLFDSELCSIDIVSITNDTNLKAFLSYVKNHDNLRIETITRRGAYSALCQRMITGVGCYVIKDHENPLTIRMKQALASIRFKALERATGNEMVFQPPYPITYP